MQATRLRLESFDRIIPQAANEPRLTLDDLDDAYERGRGTALAEHEASSAARAAAALERAAEALHTRLTDSAAMRDEAGRAVEPLIEALLSGTLPAVARARLQAALLAELRLAAEATESARLRVVCDIESVPFLAACIDRLGIEEYELHPTAPDGRIEIEMDGGQVVFDRLEMTARIEAIVSAALKGA